MPAKAKPVARPVPVRAKKRVVLNWNYVLGGAAAAVLLVMILVALAFLLGAFGRGSSSKQSLSIQRDLRRDSARPAARVTWASAAPAASSSSNA